MTAAKKPARKKAQKSARKVAQKKISDTGKKPDEILDDAPLPEAMVRNPKIALFVAQLALCGGNMAQASRECGFEESYGRQIMKRYPELKEQTARAIAQSAQSEVLEWKDMHARARRTINDVMSFAFLEPRAALEAAKVVVERIEGKVPKIIVTEDTMSSESILVRFVSALHLSKGWDVARAFEYALKNPDQVNEWARLHGLIKDKSQALAALE